MTKEIGPREKAAQERREAAYEANQKRMRQEAREAKGFTGGLDDARLARSKRLLAEAEAKAAQPKPYRGGKRDQRRKAKK